MAAITAAAVKSLRDRTGLPMMKCKQALQAADGDADAAIAWLKEKGKEKFSERADRETAFGRFGIYTSDAVGAMVEVRCESAPMTQNDEFLQFAQDVAQQLATGPGAATADELLEQPSPSKDGMSLGEQKQDLFDRMGEVFNLRQMVRIDSRCASYEHRGKTVAGVLLEYEGGSEEAARDICMHIAAMRPQVLSPEDLDADTVEAERQKLREQALQEGKPENIVDKMVEGRLRQFFAESALTEQQFVKSDDKITVGKFAEKQGMKLKQFVHWEFGEGGG